MELVKGFDNETFFLTCSILKLQNSWLVSFENFRTFLCGKLFNSWDGNFLLGKYQKNINQESLESAYCNVVSRSLTTPFT